MATTSYTRGKQAEKWAALYLRLKGYHLLYHRYKTPEGEIDLIAQKKHSLIIVEVKRRSTYQQALEALALRQQKRIERAVLYFLKQKRFPPSLAVRFDVVLIRPYRWPVHLKNAWLSEK